MNTKLQKFARRDLKQGLAQCTDAQKLLFKKMYAPGNLELPIGDVVDNMPADRLDWAMQQVGRTLAMMAARQAEEGK